MQQPTNKSPVHAPGALRFEPPADWHVDVAQSEPIKPLPAPEKAIEAALAEPLDSPPLRELAGPGDQVCIAFTHPDDSASAHLLLTKLLRELELAGVRDSDITLLCASGRRGRTDQEALRNYLGRDIFERYSIIDHDVSEVIHLGQWQGIPLTVNRRTLEADLLISVGTVAPDFYAGYSGGSETVALGCAGDTTIEALYSPRFLHNSQVRLGQTQGNPFQEILQTAAQRAGLRFTLSTILDHQGEIVDVQAGAPDMVHQYLVFAASGLYHHPLTKTYDVVVAGLTPVQQSSLYQAVLGALFIGLSPRPVIRPGGIILLPARMPQALGEEFYVQNFYSVLKNARYREMSLSEFDEQGYRPGEERAFQLLRLLEQNEVIVVGSEFPEIVEASHMQAAATMEEAVNLSRWLLGDNLNALVIPRALDSLLVSAPDEWDDWMGTSMRRLYTG